MKCKKCGLDSPSNSLFCVNCGESLKQNQQQPPQNSLLDKNAPDQAIDPTPPAEKRRKGVSFVVYAASLILLVVGFLIWVFLTADNKDANDDTSKPSHSPTVSVETVTKLMIIEQPTSHYAPIGSGVAATVTAVGDNLTYSWYVKEPGSDEFLKSASRLPTYEYLMTEEANGRQVYCVITDKHGNSVTSDTVTFGAPNPLILNAPLKDCSAFIGGGVHATVNAQGDGLTYTWYSKDVDDPYFIKSAAREAKYHFLLTEDKVGRQVFCIITDMYGKTIGTNTVTFSLKESVKITQQPKNASGKIGSKVSTTVVAEGEGLTYQWYVKNIGDTEFEKSVIRSATYEFKMTAEKSGRLVYCVVTDKYGNSVTSDTITFSAEK